MKFDDAIELSGKSVRCALALLRARRKALAEGNTVVAAELLQTILFMQDSAVAALSIAEKAVES